MTWRDSKVYVAGGTTFLGAPIVKALRLDGYSRVINGAVCDPELTDSVQVDEFFADNRPECVFMVAGENCGITANQKYPADLMFNNLQVECNVIQSAHRYNVKKLLYLASSCCYPKFCEQPMKVDSLMTGPLEPTSEAYALAKLAGIKLCQSYRQQYGDLFICAIPANPFGPGDDFDSENSHVISALIKRMYQAKLTDAPVVHVWGSGDPKRDFIFVDDLADACIFLMQEFDDIKPINLSGNFVQSIRQLAALIKDVVGYEGDLHYDTSKADGAPLKILDSSPLHHMGWRPKTRFRGAIETTYDHFLNMMKISDVNQISNEHI